MIRSSFSKTKDGLAISYATFALCVTVTALVLVISNMWYAFPKPERSVDDKTAGSLRTGDVIVVGIEHNLMTNLARFLAHTEYIHAVLVDSDNYDEVVVHEMALDYPGPDDDRRIRGFTTLPIGTWLRHVREKWRGHIDATIAIMRYSGSGGDPARLRSAVDYANEVSPKLVLNWGVHIRDTLSPTWRVDGDDKMRPRMSCMHLVATLLQRGGYISGKCRPASFSPITRLVKYEPENYREEDMVRYLLH